jgi:hypothetical protein
MLLMSGCAKELPDLEPVELPALEVVEHLEYNRSRFSSFRAVGTLRVEGKKQRWSGRAFLISHTPDSLRLELVSFLGSPILYVVSDGSEFFIWIVGRQKAYQGSTYGEALSSLFDFPLTDREALLLMAGIVPLQYPADAMLFRERNTDSLVLLFQDSSDRMLERVWLEDKTLQVTKFERTFEKKQRLEARFAEFVADQGSLYPKHIEVRSAGFSLSLRYQSLKVNEPLTPDVFHLSLPEGVEILPWQF